VKCNKYYTDKFFSVIKIKSIKLIHSYQSLLLGKGENVQTEKYIKIILQSALYHNC
jgi:hypothetical protein